MSYQIYARRQKLVSLADRYINKFVKSFATLANGTTIDISDFQEFTDYLETHTAIADIFCNAWMLFMLTRNNTRVD